MHGAFKRHERQGEKREGTAEGQGGDQAAGVWPADVTLLLLGSGRWQSEEELGQEQRELVPVLLARGWVERRKWDGGEVWFGEQVVADQVTQVPGGWHFRTTAAGEEYLRLWHESYRKERDRLLGEAGGQATARQIVGQMAPAGGQAERHGEGVGGEERKTTGTQQEAAENLKPAELKAWCAYEYAATQIGREPEDREAYDWLTEHGVDLPGDQARVLAEYELPAFDSWARYLREARRKLGENKYRRRAGRPTGRSIGRRNDL